ncbi:hypothetical protein BD626DRAFT_638128 [Schizophyllum amplum]|uniref:Uncharacterized protein n=1 Tax=Schizophyllum amplum TaxID=97359 RepID=A0A550BRW5_9AGAR|nr:hypothetical protein BD626DRAFT_638128 [Auriculariopsis ampla]
MRQPAWKALVTALAATKAYPEPRRLDDLVSRQSCADSCSHALKSRSLTGTCVLGLVTALAADDRIEGLAD